MRYETPEPSLTPKEPRVLYYCACCGGEIYEGDDCYEFSADDAFESKKVYICKDCVRSASRVAGEDD
jgi:hypothetical protein